MKYKLFATDLDGTLNDDEGIVSQENISAIKNAVDSGLKVVICSGRSHYSLDSFYERIGLKSQESYGIAFNGSVVYRPYNMEVLFEHRLKKEDALKVIKSVKALYENAPLMVYAEGNKIFYEVENSHIDTYSSKVKINTVRISDFEKELDSDVLKIILHWEHDILEDIVSRVKGEISENASVFYSSHNLLEFSHKDANKSVGLEYLAKHLGVEKDEIVSIGDNYNDMEMIKHAGFGIAVSNAVGEIKDIADFITKADNNNHAVKEALEFVMGAN